MDDRLEAINGAAERLREFLADIEAEYPVTHPNAHTDWHALKGDFALLRNGAELWARQSDRQRAQARPAWSEATGEGVDLAPGLPRAT